MNPILILLGLLSAGAVSFGFAGKGTGKTDFAPNSDNPGNGIGRKNPDTTPTTDTTTIPDTTTPPDTTTTTTTDTTTTPETPTVSDPTPTPPAQTGGTGTSGGDTTPVTIDGTVSVMAGRVATLDPAAADVTGLRIVNGLDHGNVTVNPDGTFAVVMTQSAFTGAQSFTYEATHGDGTTTLHQVDLNVGAGAQAGGWGTGESQYMLATDASDKVIVEHGEVHTKVYVSGANDALSLADIAAIEGMSVSQVTGAWLAASGYGQSEGLALDQQAGMVLWHAVSPDYSETSNWLLLESGYTYGELGTILGRGVGGEGELHPLYIGAWGQGPAPEVTSAFDVVYSYGVSNVVVQDIHFSNGSLVLNAQNFLFDNVTFSGDEVAIQWSDGVTIHNSEFLDIRLEASRNGGNWETHADRIQALYMSDVQGVLLEGNFFDYNSWEEGYYANGSSAGGQIPSMYSHNMYLAADNSDVTLRDTISMRAASMGAQVRSGGFIENNAFIDNNVGLSTMGGDYNGAGAVGEYSLILDNVITSAGYRTVNVDQGAIAWGIWDKAELTSYVDNVIAHLADPNGTETWKTITQDPHVIEAAPYYDDTIIYDWAAVTSSNGTVNDQNTQGLDTAVLDQTTIQNFTAQLLGTPTASIEDLANYLRAQAGGAFDNVVDADLIIRFFQEGFGIAPDIRPGAETLTFVPDELGDGVRWDNRLNWDTDDLPGLYAADSVDLNGNHVVFGTSATIDTLDMGPGGALSAYGGRLTLTGGVTGNEGGTLNVEGAGQVWTEGSDALDLDILVQGGRFANTGLMQNADLTATGGQTILATGGAEYDLGAAKTLAVFAAAARVGFDGDDGGMAILDMHDGATLAFAAGDGGLGSIEEFRSGAFGDAPDVRSGIDLGNATLSIDLVGLSAAAGTQFTLMDADEIVGMFNDAVVGGLGARDATIVIDYETDSVTLNLAAGSGAVTVETVGAETDVTAGEEALWDALTTGQGVFSETAPALLPEEDPLLLDAAA